jgi:histidinol phosphatase-like PHP family hydrolase
MQAEGREWVRMFSPETIAKFDYVFTDSMTFSDRNGKRMRTWIASEVGKIEDPQEFMDLLVERAVGILENEPIDIYVNPTFIPDQIAAQYDQLWTPERMARVVAAAKKNDVAIEINNRYRLPGLAFLRRAKDAGLKFTCGTNNAAAHDLGRNEYCLEMVKALNLKWQDMWVPRPDGEKPIQKRGLPKVSE